MIPDDIKNFIKLYWFQNFTHRQIHYLLESKHNYTISFHYLKRKVFKCLGLNRRHQLSERELTNALEKAQEEIENGCNGCENLRQTLKIKYNIIIKRNLARDIVRELDAAGIERRKLRRLRRRQYINRGPNYVWHIDGYDKLSRYGIFIHGCIDGFSRKVLWCEAAVTNKRPEVVASYFVKAVETQKGFPLKIRADRGTENAMVAGMHTMMHENVDSFRYGKSTSNQRIERWWGTLRQCKADFWIDHFKILEADGYFMKGNKIHMMCVQYVYLPLIKRELDIIVRLWNAHKIRKQKTGDVISGVPDLLYNSPEIVDAANCIVPIEEDFLQNLKALCVHNFILDEDFTIVAGQLLHTFDLNLIPCNFQDARNIYILLNDLINSVL